MHQSNVKFKSPLVISVHGIRTHARWQKTLSETLSSHRIASKSYDFGYYNVFRFIHTSSNEAMVDRFYDYYQSVITKSGNRVDTNAFLKRPSIVAHSFGTYIVGYGMLKYPDMKFDKVIFCGCVLPRDFDWPLLISRDQVNLIRNEYGVQDFWARIVRWGVARTGDSGYRGFNLVSSLLVQQRYDHFRHSDFFHERHIESEWMPFLNRAPSGLIVRHGRDIETSTEFAKHLASSRDIDEEAYGSLPHYDDARLPHKLSSQWIAINPDIYTFLYDRKNRSTEGYINAMPITHDKFADIKAGKHSGGHLQPSELTLFEPESTCKLYLVSIAISKSARTPRYGLYDDALLRLTYGLIDKLLWYAIERQVVVSEIVAIVWTPEGEKLCRLVGMKKIATDSDGHDVYWSNFDSHLSSRTFPGLAKLTRLYEQLKQNT